MLQLLIKRKTKKKSESTFNKRESSSYHTPKKDNGKTKRTNLVLLLEARGAKFMMTETTIPNLQINNQRGQNQKATYMPCSNGKLPELVECFLL